MCIDEHGRTPTSNGSPRLQNHTDARSLNSPRRKFLISDRTLSVVVATQTGPVTQLQESCSTIGIARRRSGRRKDREKPINRHGLREERVTPENFGVARERPVGAHQDDGRWRGPCTEMPLQIEPRHPRKVHVEQ